MAETKAAKKAGTRAKAPRPEGLTAEERSGLRELIKERQSGKELGESAVLAKIAELSPSDRAMAKRVHAVIKASAPNLEPRTWYGMPAYALNGKVVCFFQAAQKYKTRYATFGFQDPANLDEGFMWPISFALQKLTAAEEARIAALVKKAVGREKGSERGA